MHGIKDSVLSAGKGGASRHGSARVEFTSCLTALGMSRLWNPGGGQQMFTE